MFNRYQTAFIAKSEDTGNQYYLNTIYPDIPFDDNDNYIITTMGDRLDIMAQDFYGDIDFWWVIASANSLSGDSLYPPIGMQLRIPINIVSIVNNFKQINSVR